MFCLSKILLRLLRKRGYRNDITPDLDSQVMFISLFKTINAVRYLINQSLENKENICNSQNFISVFTVSRIIISTHSSLETRLPKKEDLCIYIKLQVYYNGRPKTVYLLIIAKLKSVSFRSSL